MQLVLAALGLLLTRAQGYLTGPLAARLTEGAQQLAALATQQGVNTAEVGVLFCVAGCGMDSRHTVAHVLAGPCLPALLELGRLLYGTGSTVTCRASTLLSGVKG